MNEENKWKISSSLIFDFKSNYLNQIDNSLIGSELNLASYLYLNKSNEHLNIIDLYLNNFCLYNVNYDLISGFKLYSNYLFPSVVEVQNNINKFILKQSKKNLNENKIFLLDRKNKLDRLSTLINLRTSTRNFLKQKMSFKDLSTILSYSFGKTIKDKRTFSSAGGLYPIDLYFYANNVENLKNSVYWYDYSTNSISEVDKEQSFDLEKVARMDNINYQNCSIFIFFVWNSNLSRFKYNMASLGFAFIEVGEITRNIELVSSSLDYGICALGGLNKNYLDEYLEIDDIYLANAIHAIILGKKE